MSCNVMSGKMLSKVEELMVGKKDGVRSSKEAKGDRYFMRRVTAMSRSRSHYRYQASHA